MRRYRWRLARRWYAFAYQRALVMLLDITRRALADRMTLKAENRRLRSLLNDPAGTVR